MLRTDRLLVLSVLLWLAPSIASAQVAPRITIAVDTSGSMALDMNGVPTFGDGVLTGCSLRGDGAYCGSNCTAGIDTDCNDEPDDSRIYIAKEAITNMVLSTGDVDWALARFHQTQSSNRSCLRINQYECNTAGPYVTSYGNPQCNSGNAIPHGGFFGTCPFDWPSLWPAACAPDGSGETVLRTWRSGDPNVCTNYEGTCTGGDVLVGFSDLGEYVGRTNAFGILKWVDNEETAFVNTTTTGNYCNHATTGDCELRPEGATPLEGILTASRNYMVGVRGSDAAAACRPYSILLITDGVESCSGNPQARAGTILSSDDIRTYVVGMSIASSADRTNLNNIAVSGGTGGAYFADDPDTLAAALSEIVADSLLIEVCNNVDDDCDGLVDEGFTKYCDWDGTGPVPAATLCADPGETCDGVDNNCNGVVDEGVTNACGTCGPVPTEVCDGLDNDCDGIIDEGGVCSGCTPTTEICDNVDNDCDGSVDEGLTRPCGTDVGECTAGTQACAAGAWGTCSGTGPTAEVCDGLDNDCDGAIDGITRPCGISTGACSPGTETCVMGPSWSGVCVGEVGPSPEICDDVDNDCDGATDEGDPGGGGSCGSSIGECSPGVVACVGGVLTCTGGSSPMAEGCDGLDNDCDGATDEGIPSPGACGTDVGECSEGALTCVAGDFVCVGGRGPTGEVCDGLDNDCDGATDEGNPGGGVSCGTDVGECTPGTSRCVGGSLVCEGGTPGGAEICDGLDNDCDGLVDEGNPGGGGSCGTTDEGECEFGALACVSGSLVCRGETGPSPEICDGLDNDCDGMIDEGNPEGGGACGDDTGECTPGTWLCTGGALVCDGGTGPTPEVCNGLDDDCDGVVDDGLGVGAPCGSDTGECAPGVQVCREGALVCEGEVGPIDEVCDLLDNDCDGEIDEGLGLGDACGSDEGICMPGTQQCVDGRIICVGAVPPAREACDCEDNDCDGTVDEPPDSGDLCPPGSECIDCGCALPCMESEFGFTCPSGRTPKVIESGECYCVMSRCDADECAGETLPESAETARCAPDSDDVSHCVCKNNACTFPCDGVVCSDGLVCDPRDPAGRCVPDDCTGLGCPDGELCDPASGECEPNPCADVSCDAGEACRDGSCEPSCASVECGDGEHCRAGACVPDLCVDTTCATAEYCDPETGECADDPCVDRRCGAGTVCDHATGTCVEDPCNRLVCPEDEVCRDGECAEGGMSGSDAGPGGTDAGFDAGTSEPRAEGTRVLATGGGGCVCSVPGSDARGPGAPALGILFGLLGLLGWRRLGRRTRRLRSALPLLLVLAVTAALVAGCDVEPYCIDCVEEADAGPRDTGVADTGVRDTGAPDTGAPDAGPEDGGPDGCVPGAPELCNGLDDDCDGEVDEGIDTSTDVNNCGGCGMACSPPHAFGECVEGVCGLATCDVGWHDLNGDLDDGCEYRCLVTETDDSVCDLRDNDCDGEVDEDIDFDTDPINCRSCGRVCRFAHAAGACVDGDCVLGACDDGFHDVDGDPSNGCEYTCTPADPPVEVCNGRDDDCDGDPDEGDPGGGAVCGTDEGACSTGIERCIGGTIVCDGSVEPTTEECNGIDDDCDGVVDQGNPEGGALCGTGTGTCEQGREQCIDGALVCTGDVGPTAEVCDGLDNDCDGHIDEGDPEGGGACGDGTGACVEGTLHCRGGVLVCEDAIGPSTETCNGVDDDCDGSTDEGNPGGGGSCGTDAGECAPGTWQCTGGTLSCIGATGPSTETCNALDDDCDGSIDEGNPGGGAACGPTTGACSAGFEECLGGALQCTGATGPTLETCNGVDDDCDATTDEGFDLMNDLRNCGMCGRTCSYDHASASCSSGSCAMGACDPGWVDRNGLDSDGCEYECDYAGAEICNGRDDDCDGTTDLGLTPPSNFCNPNGVCAGTSATCGGASGWTCVYPGTYEETEATCDGLDNDCDGGVDEPFPLVGSSCSNGGTGVCRTTGTYVCNGAGDGVTCTAPAGPAPTTEVCDDRDNDCDGAVDEGIPLSAIPAVTIARAGGGTVRVFSYEASRPDATSADAGSASTVACSTANRIPWTDVTWPEANAACCALNPSGTCGATGWRLCDSADWQRACERGSSCTWAYSSSCNSSNPTRCNGEEHDCSGSSGDQDCLYPTRSSTFPYCYADWGSAGRVYDMSGNVKEWTYDERVPGLHDIRGGAYNNVEAGRTCQFDYTLGDETFSFPHTGFRCCYY